MRLPGPSLKTVCFQFRRLGSREAVRQRVLEVVNHVDKVGCPRDADTCLGWKGQASRSRGKLVQGSILSSVPGHHLDSVPLSGEMDVMPLSTLTPA